MQSGELRDELRVALLDAFRTPGEMKIVVDYADLGVSFGNFLAAEGTTYDSALFALLQWVDAQDKVLPLMNSAGRKNRGNPRLREVRAKLADLESRFSELRPAWTFEEAERIVLKGVKFEDVGPWINQLATMRRAVCRIEPQPESDTIEGYGTGFLVAPNVVMTNYHVASSLWLAKERAERVTPRFDYESAVPGGSAFRGTEHKLALTGSQSSDPADESAKSPWQVCFSPRTLSDWTSSCSGWPDRLETTWCAAEAPILEADFAAILRDRPGPDPPAPRRRTDEALVRGRREARSAESCRVQGQHPRGILGLALYDPGSEGHSDSSLRLDRQESRCHP